jgi:hypothetical protein
MISHEVRPRERLRSWSATRLRIVFIMQSAGITIRVPLRDDAWR